MATTQEIIRAAEALGKLLAEHQASKTLAQASEKLNADIEAQRVLNDYNRHLMGLAEKESKGKPIEVDDKRKLQQLQDAVVTNEVLRNFQMAQMDYLDLMRQVDTAMTGERPGGEMAEKLAAAEARKPLA